MTRGKRSQPSPQRTEEERERDRTERERRRAERAAAHGKSTAAAALPPQAPSEEPPVARAPEPASDRSELVQPPGRAAPVTPEAHDDALAHPEPPQAQAPEPPQAQAPGPADWPVSTPPGPSDPAAAPPDAGAPPSAPFVPPPAPSSGSVPAPQQATEDHPALETPAPDHAGEPAGEELGPDPAVATAAGGDAASHGSRLPPPPPPAPSGRAGPLSFPAPPARRRPGGRAPLPRALAVVALAAVVAAIVLLVKSLAGAGQAKKTPAPAVARVVIPEGSTRLQIAQIAAADGLKGSYRGASKRSTLLDPTHYGGPAGTHDLEGFLFPATYDLLPGAPVSRLVREQLVAFRENFGSSEIARARALHVTPYQLLTIASMVEREAKVAGDRAKISAVIYNRLRKGMPLGIDATIYYALEMQKGIPTYTKELTATQLRLNSPYNTRTRTGLPPTPISNPGLASIEAAMKPARVSYLYYVLAADGCGEHVFSTTLAKFEADAAAYQAAVKKNGGAPPTCKK